MKAMRKQCNRHFISETNVPPEPTIHHMGTWFSASSSCPPALPLPLYHVLAALRTQSNPTLNPYPSILPSPVPPDHTVLTHPLSLSPDPSPLSPSHCNPNAMHPGSSHSPQSPPPTPRLL